MITGANTGCNIWEPTGGLGPLPSGIAGIAGWWESHPKFGTPWVRSNASISGLPWPFTTNFSLNVGGGPFPADYNIREVAVVSAHYNYQAALLNAADPSYCDFHFIAKGVNHQWYQFYVTNAIPYWRNFDTLNGVIGVNGNHAMTVSSLGGGYYHFLLSFRNPTAVASLRYAIYGKTGDNATPASDNYLGIITDGFDCPSVYVRQERITQLNNLITGGGAATKLGGVIATEPLFQDTFDTFSPFAVPLQELGRAVTSCVRADAAVNACFNGAASHHTVFGVRRIDTNLGAFYLGTDLGFANEGDFLRITGANIEHYRIDGAGVPTITTWAGASPGLGTKCSFCLICDPAIGETLFINGVNRGTQVPGVPRVIAAFSDFNLNWPLNTLQCVWPATALFPTPAAVAHQTIYDTIVRPPLMGMGARWGGIAA